MEVHIELEQAAKIKVFGVGGGGGNAVQNMINSNLEGVSFICANTDVQALAKSNAEHKIQLGKGSTRGLGAGARPEVGQAAAEESLDEIREAIGDADMVFVTAGMGGGTGTGAAPIIAKVAKEKGILTVGVVTKPFHFEGDKRMNSAMRGVEALRKHVDSLVTIPNDRLLAISPKGAKVTEMLKKADDVLKSAVSGVTDLITKPGMINADFADVRTVMSVQGMALMGEGAAAGENRALEAAKRAITSPLLEDISISGAQAMLVNIMASDLGMDEFDTAATYIREAARGNNTEDPEIIVAMSVDENLGDELRITVIATGIVSATNAAAQSAGAAKITSLTSGKAAPAVQAEIADNRAFRPVTRQGAIPKEITRNPTLFRGFEDEDRSVPTYLRVNEHRMQQAADTRVHTPGAEDFTFEEESDVPTFIRRQAN